MGDEFYCSKCGNTGENFETGERCNCRIGAGDFESNKTACLFVPEQYRGAGFDIDLLPHGLGAYYYTYMNELYSGVSQMGLRNLNVFLSSPPKHGKTVLAYTCIEKLYRRGVEVFPLYDVMELRRMIMDRDNGKRNEEIEELGLDVTDIYKVPYLFLKLTPDLSFVMFDTLKLILDRRLRRSGSVTIVLSDMPWNYIVEADKKGVFKTLAGDGSFGSLKNMSFTLNRGGE